MTSQLNTDFDAAALYVQLGFRVGEVLSFRATTSDKTVVTSASGLVEVTSGEFGQL